MSAFAAEISLPSGDSLEPPTLHVDGAPKALGQPDHNDHRTVYTQRYTLDDGTRYDAQVFMPHRAISDVPVTATTPWMTHLRGFNALQAEMLAEQGVMSVHISPEHLRPQQLLRRLGGIPLAHDAHAQHAILDDIEHGFGTASSIVINTGYSRGSMVAFGFNALSRQYGRDVRYGDYTDPCLEHGLRGRDIDWRHLPQDALAEGREIVAGMCNETMRNRRRILGGIPLDPVFWLEQAPIGRTIFSGETGTFLPNLHPSTAARVTFYAGNRYNHAADFQRRLASYQNIVIAVEPGRHNTGMHPRVREATVGRILLAQNLIADNATAAELANAAREPKPDAAATADLLSVL